MEILDKYIVNPHTLAIFPAREIEYQAIVWEGEQTYKVNKTPLEIIKESCLVYWSTFDAKRKAVAERLGFINKTPIPVITDLPLIVFPTTSFKDADCVWMISNHVLTYQQVAEHKIIVHFNNERDTYLDLNDYKFHNQMVRSLMLYHDIFAQKSDLIESLKELFKVNESIEKSNPHKKLTPIQIPPQMWDFLYYLYRS